MDEEWSCNNEYKDNGNSNGVTTGGTGDGKAWRDNYTDDDVEKLNEVYINDNALPTENWKMENQTEVGKASIRKYGGFYIARYEAGIPDEATFSISKTTENGEIKYVNTQKQIFSLRWSNDTVNYGRGSVADTNIIRNLKPVSKKGMQAWNYITQPNSKLVAENMYKESNSVDSYLVDSQAWNHICKNIFKANKGANDSTTWGNYYNNTTTDYKNLNCLWAEHKNGSDSWAIASSYKIGGIQDSNCPKGQGDVRLELSTGASEDFKKYNIYDMAGNMWEWTTGHNVVLTDEKNEQMFVVTRGGSYDGDSTEAPMVRANGVNSFKDYQLFTGFRVVLYIE